MSGYNFDFAAQVLSACCHLFCSDILVLPVPQHFLFSAPSWAKVVTLLMLACLLFAAVTVKQFVMLFLLGCFRRVMTHMPLLSSTITTLQQLPWLP